MTMKRLLLLILACLLPFCAGARRWIPPQPVAAGGTPAWVGEIQRGSVNDANATAIITLSAGIAQGHTIAVVVLSSAGALTSAAVDSKLNTYLTPVTSGNDGTASQGCSIIYAYATTALVTSDTITITWGGTTGSQVKAWCVVDLSGCASAGQPDQTKARSVYGSTVSEAASTTATKTTLLGLLTLDDNTKTYGSSSWTVSGAAMDASTRRSYIVHKDVSAAGSQNPGGSWSGASGQANAWAALK